MKKTIYSLTLIAAMSLFSITSNASNLISTDIISIVDGGHECSDKCKKDKDGKCSETSSDVKGKDGEKAACCSKADKKSCHKDKASEKEKNNKKEGSEPKS